MEFTTKKEKIERIKNGMLIIKNGDTTTVTVGAGTVYQGEDYIIDNARVDNRQERADLLYVLINELTDEKLIEAFKSCCFSNISIPNIENLLQNGVTIGEKSSIRTGITSVFLGQQFLSEEIKMKSHVGMFYTDYSYLTDNYRLINRVFYHLEKKSKYYKYRSTEIQIYKIANADRLMSGFKGSFNRELDYEIIKMEHYLDDIPDSWIENKWI